MGEDFEEGAGVVGGGSVGNCEGEFVAGELLGNEPFAAGEPNGGMEKEGESSERAEPIPPKIATGEVGEFVRENEFESVGGTGGKKWGGEEDGGVDGAKEKGTCGVRRGKKCWRVGEVEIFGDAMGGGGEGGMVERKRVAAEALGAEPSVGEVEGREG